MLGLHVPHARRRVAAAGAGADWPYLTGVFLGADYQKLTDGTVPANKFRYITVDWFITTAQLSAIKAMHPAAKILVYQNFANMRVGTHGTVDGIRRATSLVTYEDAVANSEGWFLHSATPISSANRIALSGFPDLYPADVADPGWRVKARQHMAQILPAGYHGVMLDDANPFKSGFSGDVEFATDNAYRDAATAAIVDLGVYAKGLGLIVAANIGGDPWNGNHRTGFTNMLGGLTVANRESYQGWSATTNTEPFTGSAFADVQGLITEAEAAGVATSAEARDLTPSDAQRSVRYGQAAFLLEWGGVTASAMAMNSGQPLSSYAHYRKTLGLPLGAKTLVSGTATDGAWMRHWTGGVVCVNAQSTLKALGLNGDQTTVELEAEVDHIIAVGAEAVWIVVDIAWAFPSSTTIDSAVAAKYDAMINRAYSAGRPVILQVHSNPSWIVTSSGHTYPGNVWHGPDHATERSNWVTCLHNFINRYGSAKIHSVEIWNEPNLTEFWVQGWNVTDYIRLLRDCWIDIKASWPTIRIVGHNLARNDDGWMDQAFQWWNTTFGAPDGVAKNYGYDDIGLHPYAGPNSVGTGYAPSDNSHGFFVGANGNIYLDYQGFETVRANVQTREGVWKPVAFGEFGYDITSPSGNWFSATEAQRAQWLADAVAIARSKGYVRYLNVYRHDARVAESGLDFNIHGTNSEASFTTAGLVTFTLGGNYYDPTGASVTSVQLDNGHGMVLLTAAPAPPSGETPVTRTALSGGGFQNAGAAAPAGVGHNWLLVSGADVAFTHATTDGITWKPANLGLVFGQHRIAALHGSLTVANRIWALASATQAGTGTAPVGRILRGAYDPATGLITWTQFATLTLGVAAGVANQPRQVGKLLASDEANGFIYAGNRDGVWRIDTTTGVATQRALAGAHITAMVLDPNDTQIMWVTADADGASAGVHRIANVRSGAVAVTSHTTLTNPQDLSLVDTGATRYLYCAAQAQGPRRWTVSADITTGWTDFSAGYNLGGNGCAKITARWTGSAIKVLATNAGDNSMTNAGAYSSNGGSTWVSESTSWATSLVPRGETESWWLGVVKPAMMLPGGSYDASTPHIEPTNLEHFYLFGRSGIWWSGDGGANWRPAIRGLAATVGWHIRAHPTLAGHVAIGDGDWTCIATDTADSLVSMPTMHQPTTGTGMGLYYREDTALFGLAIGETSTGLGGAVYTTPNVHAASPTWTEQGFAATAGGVPCVGLAIGENGSGSQVILTVREGVGIQRKVGAAAPTTVSTLTTSSGDLNPRFCWPKGSSPSMGRQWVYVNSSVGLLRSADRGATWTNALAWTNTREYTGAIVADPANPDVLYVTRDDGTGPGTGLFKITSPTGTPVATKIGPTVTDPGPCAINPTSGRVFLAVTADESGGAKLYRSDTADPGAATTFSEVSDSRWAAAVLYPHDLSVGLNHVVYAANKQGGHFALDGLTA